MKNVNIITNTVNYMPFSANRMQFLNVKNHIVGVKAMSWVTCNVKAISCMGKDSKGIETQRPRNSKT